jgi:hypothetical protein
MNEEAAYDRAVQLAAACMAASRATDDAFAQQSQTWMLEAVRLRGGFDGQCVDKAILRAVLSDVLMRAVAGGRG